MCNCLVSLTINNVSMYVYELHSFELVLNRFSVSFSFSFCFCLKWLLFQDSAHYIQLYSYWMLNTNTTKWERERKTTISQTVDYYMFIVVFYSNLVETLKWMLLLLLLLFVCCFLIEFYNFFSSTFSLPFTLVTTNSTAVVLIGIYSK